MIENKFTRKNGDDGYDYRLESGDVFKPKFDKAFKIDKKDGMKFDKYILAVDFKGEERTITLTPKQAESIETLGNASSKELECTNYDTKYRKGCEP